MMQLPAGATGFFEAGTFREPIQRGEFLQLVYQLARESRCTVEETDTSLCGKKLLCRTNRPKQWNRNSVHERIYRPSGLFRLLGSTAAPIYSALSCAGRPASAESAALPLVTGTIHQCGAAGCTGSGRARAAALLATQHNRGNSV